MENLRVYVVHSFYHGDEGAMTIEGHGFDVNERGMLMIYREADGHRTIAAMFSADGWYAIEDQGEATNPCCAN